MLAAPSAMKKLRPSPPEPAVPYCHWSNVTSRPRLDADAFVYTAPPLRLPVASVSCRYPVEALADGDPTRRAQTPSDDEVDAGATVARVRQPSPSARHEPSVTVEPVNDSETRAEPVAVVATGAAEAGAATATSAPSATTAGTSATTTRRLTVDRPRSVALLVDGMVFPLHRMVLESLDVPRRCSTRLDGRGGTWCCRSAIRQGLVNLPASRNVSYTHLRAHETDSYLVCRLL